MPIVPIPDVSWQPRVDRACHAGRNYCYCQTFNFSERNHFSCNGAPGGI